MNSRETTSSHPELAIRTVVCVIPPYLFAPIFLPTSAGRSKPRSDNLFGQAGINKLQQNLRRRITGRAEVVIEFSVIGFPRSKDRRLHSRCLQHCAQTERL